MMSRKENEPDYSADILNRGYHNSLKMYHLINVQEMNLMMFRILTIPIQMNKMIL